MEQRFKTSGQDIDLLPLREFIEREGEAVAYRRGDQLEREGDPTRWFAFVTEGCFKYITYGLSEILRVGELARESCLCSAAPASSTCSTCRISPRS